MMDQAVQLLVDYIRIDTTNPPGNEFRAAAFFQNIFQQEGIAFKTYESDSGRVSVRAVLKGNGAQKPLMLLNHMDVVSAEAEEWSMDPFGGEIKDGFIYGRGTLDMKSQGIMELMAFLEMKRSGIQLNRDILFVATADEENGGRHGIQFLMENYPEDFSADIVINEGGFGISGMLPDKPVFMIAAAEKGLLWLKVKATGLPGHGSAPHGQNALEKLTRAIARLLAVKTPVILTPIVQTYFTNLAAAGWDFLEPFRKDQKAETLEELLTQTGFIQMPQIAAMLKNTISLTQLHAGEKTNVIPASAEATFDTRLLPGQSPEEFIQWIQTTMDDDSLQLEILTLNEASESPVDTPCFRQIKEVIQTEFPMAMVTPSLLFATSDSRMLRRQGITTYGFCPAVIDVSDIQRIHGIDERISIENIHSGINVMIKIVHKLCTD